MPLPWTRKSIRNYATDGLMNKSATDTNSSSLTSQLFGGGRDKRIHTIEVQVIPDVNDVNDWEVEIVPVPPKPKLSTRTISFSKRRSSSCNNKSSQEEEEFAVVPEDPAMVPTPMTNHLFNCVSFADGILTAASETVLDMLVKTITVADEVCTSSGSKTAETV